MGDDNMPHLIEGPAQVFQAASYSPRAAAQTGVQQYEVVAFGQHRYTCADGAYLVYALSDLYGLSEHVQGLQGTVSHRGAGWSSGFDLSGMMARMLGDTCDSFLEFAAHHLVTLGALAALFLPLLGPVMDHHFAERQPGHAHMYLEGERRDHLHSYETDDHHIGRSTASGYDNAGQDGAVVILTDTHGLGSGAAGTPAYLRQAVILIFRHEGDANRFAFSAGSVFLTDAAVPVPKQPPRI